MASRRRSLRVLQSIQSGEAEPGSQPQGAAAADVARDLIRNSDIVVENFAAGVMDRLGFGFDVCRQLRPTSS
jgi:hypothetical protein